MSARPRRHLLRRIVLAAISLAIVVATFVYFLPTIANYGAVWRVVKGLSWPQMVRSRSRPVGSE